MNYLAILTCAVASMVIGAVWYGPLFSRAYGRAIGMDMANMTPEQKASMKKRMGGMYFVQFLLSFITAGVLEYHIANWANFATPSLGIALCTWFGFVMTTTAGAAIWSGRPKKMAWKIFWISTGAQVLTFAAYGLILGAWK